MAGVGIDAAALRVTPIAHARDPHNKNDHTTPEYFFQYHTAAMATTIIPVPLRRKRGCILTLESIAIRHWFAPNVWRKHAVDFAAPK